MRPQTAARQVMLEFRRAASVPGGCLVIAPLLQAQVEATTELLTTCFSEAMRYPPIYRYAATLGVPLTRLRTLGAAVHSTRRAR